MNVPGRIGGGYGYQKGGYGYQNGGYAQRFPKIMESSYWIHNF